MLAMGLCACASPVDPVTDPVTDPITDPATEPATDPATDPATEPATEPSTEPATEPATEPVVTPADAVVSFDPSAISEDISAANNTNTAITGSTGVATIQAGPGSVNANIVVSLENEDGASFVRFTNTDTYTYSQFVLFLESDACPEAGEYTFDLTFRLSEGFTSTDANAKQRAVILRALNGGSVKGDANVVTRAQLEAGETFTEWTTVSVTISPNSKVTGVAIIIFANPNDYIDIKSLAVYPPASEPLPDLVIPDADAIKIACMGDSLTAGTGIPTEERPIYSYPGQLQQLLGSKYNVLNCGRSGATVLRNDSKYFNGSPNAYHYGSVQKYKDAKAFAPDIAVIMLGTNDGPRYIDKVGDDPAKQAEFKAEFIKELEGYGKTMESLNPDVKIYLMLSPPYEKSAEKSENIKNNIHPIVREIAEANGWEVIDIYSAIEAHITEGIYTDGLHFTKDGYAIIANAVAAAITNN